MPEITDDQLRRLRDEIRDVLVDDLKHESQGVQEAFERFAGMLSDAAFEAVQTGDMDLLQEVQNVSKLLARSYNVKLSRAAQESARKTLQITVRFLIAILSGVGA